METRERIFQGLKWGIIIQALLFLARFASGVFLARMLMPEDYGQVAYIVSIIMMLLLVRALGFDAFVVQCEPGKLKKYGGTAYALNLLASAGVLVLAIPGGIFLIEARQWPLFFSLLAAHFVGISLVVNGGILQREMRYERLSVINLVSSLLSIGVGVIMAWMGYGVWSLVLMHVVRIVTDGVLSLFWMPYFLKPCFHRAAVCEIWEFGKHYWVGVVSTRSSENLDKIVIQKMSGERELGFYNQAYGLSTIVTNFLDNIFTSVAGPVFSKFKHDPDRLARGYCELMALTMRVNAVVVVVLWGLAYELVELLYTAKWLFTAPILRVLLMLGFLASAVSMTRTFFIYVGTPRVAAASQNVLLVMLLILVVPLTSAFGAIGCALAVNAAFLAGLFAMVRVLRSIIQVNLLQVFGIPVLISASVIAVYVVILRQFFIVKTWGDVLEHSLMLVIMHGMMALLLDRHYWRSLYGKWSGRRRKT